jgi:CubicO group peptidase (beta-lactamase class C family)
MKDLDLLHWLGQANLPGTKRCRVPRDTDEVLDVGPEDPGGADVPAEDVLRVWAAVEALYRTGVHPALQLCVRRRGVVVLNRAIGHARGNGPDDPPDAPKLSASAETPFDLFSASKAVTAMVIHKLDEKRVLHLEDRVCDFIPEFAKHGKNRITVRHLLAHKAGIPNLPPEAMDLDLLGQPEKVVEILCDARLRSRPGRLLAYHAVSGGFVLAEVVRRVTGDDIRSVLEREIVGPLGYRWMRYGVKPEDLPLVARDEVTGPPVPWPASTILKGALGGELAHVIDLSNDPRFLTGIVPSANIVSTAYELGAFYQCLLDEGEQQGVRVFEPSTIRHATGEAAWWELDLTLGLPLRYGLGFMLGSSGVSLFGRDNETAFGHIGFTNIFSWADPERALSVALCANGKPVVSLHAVRLLQWMFAIDRAFPKVREATSG